MMSLFQSSLRLEKSEHPIAHAIVNYAQRKISQYLMFQTLKEYKERVLGKIKDTEYFVGNAKLVSDLKISFDANKLDGLLHKGKTPVILATNEKFLVS